MAPSPGRSGRMSRWCGPDLPPVVVEVAFGGTRRRWDGSPRSLTGQTVRDDTWRDRRPFEATRVAHAEWELGCPQPEPRIGRSDFPPRPKHIARWMATDDPSGRTQPVGLTGAYTRCGNNGLAFGEGPSHRDDRTRIHGLGRPAPRRDVASCQPLGRRDGPGRHRSEGPDFERGRNGIGTIRSEVLPRVGFWRSRPTRHARSDRGRPHGASTTGRAGCARSTTGSMLSARSRDCLDASASPSTAITSPTSLSKRPRRS